MNYTMLKGKIHRAVVKQADLNYVGSITVDTKLLEAAGILEYEMVQIVDVENGNRFETYTIAGEPGSGMICLNGAAARQVAVGDHVILMCYAQMTPEEAKVLAMRAKDAGLSESAYLRLLIEQKPNDYPEIRKMLKVLINEVNRIGVNINQITYNNNTELYSKEDKESLTAYMRKLNLEVKKVVEQIGN